jgi:hypothetical protein
VQRIGEYFQCGFAKFGCLWECSLSSLSSFRELGIWGVVHSFQTLPYSVATVDRIGLEFAGQC